MAIIEYYLIFSITTALVSLFGFYLPVLKEAKARGVNNVLTSSPILGSLIYLAVTTVLAPFVFPATILPAQGQMFRVGLERAVYKSDEE